MSDLRKAAEMALEALEDKPTLLADWLDNLKTAREALRQALAQPEYQTVSAPQPQTFTGQKPVVWEQFHTPDSPLYTAPPKREWVGLTKEELMALSDEWRIMYGGYVKSFAEAIEAKLKEKNT